MATYYIDPVSGSDTNTGTNPSLPRKNFPGTSSVGDTFKWKASPEPTTVPDCTATWTDLAKNVDVTWTAGSAPFYLLDNGSTLWTAVAGKSTVANNVASKQPYSPWRTSQLSVNNGATAGKLGYLPFASPVDLSAYQQISLWIVLAPNGMTGLQIKLCSDNAGNTPVNSFDLPDSFFTASINNRYFCITLDNGANLGSSIGSIAIYSTSTLSNAAQAVRIDTLIACKNTADAFTMNSLVGKGTTGETWYGIAYISDYMATGCKIWLDNQPSAQGANGANTRGYTAQTKGLVETLPLKKRQPFTYQRMGVPTGTVFTLNRAGSAAAQTIHEGGYSDFSLPAPDGETWFDSQADSATIFSAIGAYITLRNFGFVRGNVGLSFNGGLGCELHNISANNCASGISILTASRSIFKIASANNCSNGAISSVSTSEFYINQAANNVNSNMAIADDCKYRPWTTLMMNVRNGGIGNGATAALLINGKDSYIYDADFRDSTNIVCWNNQRGKDVTLSNCKISFTSSFNANGFYVISGKVLVSDYNQVAGDYRIYTSNRTTYQKSGTDAYVCTDMVIGNAPAFAPSELKLAEFAVVAGRPVSVSIGAKRNNFATYANFVLKDDVENTLVTSATTSAADNTYETFTLNYTPTKTGFLRFYWYSWTIAGSGTNEITIRNLKIGGMANQLLFKNFGFFGGGIPQYPNSTGSAAAQIGSAFVPLLEIPTQTIKSGQTAYFEFPVQDSAGAAVAPDSVATMFRRNNAQDVAVVASVTTSSGLGLGSVVVPAGYSLNDAVSVEVQVTVGGVVGAWTTVWRGRVSDVASEVWGATTRTLSGFGFTVNTNANATETAIKAKTDVIGASVAAVSDVNISVSDAYTVDDRTRDNETNELIVERLTLPEYPPAPTPILEEPAIPENVIIYGYIRDFEQEAVAGIEVKLRYTNSKITIGDSFPTDFEVETVSGEDGFFQFESAPSSLIKPITAGTTHILTVGDVDYSIRVPDDGGNAVNMVR